MGTMGSLSQVLSLLNLPLSHSVSGTGTSALHGISSVHVGHLASAIDVSCPSTSVPTGIGSEMGMNGEGIENQTHRDETGSVGVDIAEASDAHSRTRRSQSIVALGGSAAASAAAAVATSIVEEKGESDSIGIDEQLDYLTESKYEEDMEEDQEELEGSKLETSIDLDALETEGAVVSGGNATTDPTRDEDTSLEFNREILLNTTDSDIYVQSLRPEPAQTESSGETCLYPHVMKYFILIDNGCLFITLSHISGEPVPRRNSVRGASGATGGNVAAYNGDMLAQEDEKVEQGDLERLTAQLDLSHLTENTDTSDGGLYNDLDVSNPSPQRGINNTALPYLKFILYT